MGCGSYYPRDEQLRCENAITNHAVCVAFDDAQFAQVHWNCPTYEPPPPSETRSGGREKARAMAKRAEPPMTLMASVRAAARRAKRSPEM